MRPAIRRIALLALVLLVTATATLMLPLRQWRTGRQPVAPLALQPGSAFAAPAERVWIDSDAACGHAARTDPDDCFALLLLLLGRAGTSPLQIAGVSSVFGNAPLAVTDRTLRELVNTLPSSAARPAVHTGRPVALGAGGAPQPAERALRAALRATTSGLTLVALGPLTNIAAALQGRPELQARVTRIVAVMGRRPGHLFHPAEGRNGDTGHVMLLGHGPVFRDLNFSSDPQAAAAIVAMGVPLVLVPYDAARHVEIHSADLDRLGARGGTAAWVAQRARGWLAFWQGEVGHSGFYPFDALAAAFALQPRLLRCAPVRVRVAHDRRFIWPFDAGLALLAGPLAADEEGDDSAVVTGHALYCPGVDARLQGWLAQRLAQPAAP